MNKFGELIFGNFVDILRNSGSAPNSVQMEKMRDSCSRLGESFTTQCRLEAQKECEKLQEAITAAFKKVDEKFDDVHTSVSSPR